MSVGDANMKMETAFLQLIEEKPYAKITVNDIVDRAGVHRNTFYYHYQSIPALLDEICRRMVSDMTALYVKVRTPADCIIPLIRYSRKHRSAILHVYESEARSVLMDYVGRICRFSIEHFIDKVTERTGISSRDKELLTRFFTAGLVGVWTEWVEEGLEGDSSEDFVRIGSILERMTLDSFIK